MTSRAIQRLSVPLTLALAALVLAAPHSRAVAQPEPQPSASTTPRPTPIPGYVGAAELVAQAPFMGNDKLTLGGRLSFEISDTKARVDLLSVSIPGTDATVNALAGTQLFPPGGITFVFDRTNSTFTAWSPSKRLYYASERSRATPAPRPTASPAPTPSPGGDSNFFSMFSALKFIKDLEAFNATISLVGHGTTNGHPTTGVDFVFTRKDKNDPPMEAHGRVQFADDLDEFPIQVSANAKAAAQGPLRDISARLDITRLDRQRPPAADFLPPQGFTRTKNLGDVFVGVNLPGVPAPRPSP